MSQPPQGPPPGPPPQGPPSYGPPQGPPGGPGFPPPTGGGGMSGKVLAAIIVGAVVLLGAGIGAVFALTGGSDAPDDASVEEFCDTYTGLTEVFTGLDFGAPEDEQAEQMLDGMKSWADDMEETGTPGDMPDDAREGFELMIGTIKDLDPDDFDSPDAFDKLEDSFSDEEQEKFDALEQYVEEQEECQFFDGGEVPDASDLPTDELPSDLPTDELPSELPTDDLPTDFPTELPSELESEFSDLESLFSDMPTDFPTE